MIKKEIHLLVERTGNRLYFPQYGKKNDFFDLDSELIELVNYYTYNNQKNFQTINQKKSIEIDSNQLFELFKIYGYKLYKNLRYYSIIDPDDSIKSIQIFDNSKQYYHWELLYDGERFCQKYIPITRSYLPKYNVKAKFLTRKKYHLAFFQGVFVEYNNYSYPNDKITIKSWLNFDESINGIRIDSFGLVNRSRLINLLSNFTPNLIVISAYCDQNGILEYNEQTGLIDIIPYYSWGTMLKNAVAKGLDGIVFQFWDCRTNLPLLYNQNWLNIASLEFAIELCSPISQKKLSIYLNSYVKELICGKDCRKAHLKSLAKLTFDSNDISVNSDIKIHQTKEIHTVKKLNFNLIPDQISHLSVKPELVKLNQKITDNVYINDFTLQIYQLLINGNKKRVQLRSDYNYSILEHFYLALSLFSYQDNISISELFLPFNCNFLNQLEDNTSNDHISFISSLWDVFINFKLSSSKSRFKYIVIFGLPPKSKFFEYWLDKKIKNEWRIVLIDKQEYAGFKQVFPKKLSNFQNSKNHDNQQIIELFDNQLWREFLSKISEEDKKLTMYSNENNNIFILFQKYLTKKQLEIIEILFIFKDKFLFIDFIKIIDSYAESIDFKILTSLNFIHITLDNKYIYLDSGIYLFILEGLIFDKNKLKITAIKIANNLKLEISNSIINIFSAITNLAEYLAFQGEYRIAISVLIQLREYFIKSNNFSKKHLYVWGINCFNWGEHLPEKEMPNWAASIWNLFISPVITEYDSKMAENYIKTMLEKFSQNDQWGAYALAIVDLAKINYQLSNSKQIIVSLNNEAIKIAQNVSTFNYNSVYLEIFKNIALFDDKKLFDVYVEKFKFNMENNSIDLQHKKSLILIDIWYLYSNSESSKNDLIENCQKLLETDINYPSKLEIKVLLLLTKYFEKNDNKYQLLTHKRLIKVAIRLNDQDLLLKNYQSLVDYYYKEQLWDGALIYVKKMLQIARNHSNLEAIKNYCDTIAMIYYKLGNTKLNTSYYSLSQDPSQLLHY